MFKMGRIGNISYDGNDERFKAIKSLLNAIEVLDIIPNPQGTTTENLYSIQIGDDIFKIVGSGGGGSDVSVNPIITTGDSIATITVDGQVFTLKYDASSKADASSVYTKSEVNTSLVLKADKSTTYTKTEVDNALSTKANQSTTYTKTEVDTSLNAKANKSTTYTKTEVDTALASKSEVTMTPTYNSGVKIADYTIDGVAGAIYVQQAGISISVDPVITTGDTIAIITVDGIDYYLKYDASSKADASSVYTKTEVDTALSAKADTSTTYTKTEVDTALSAKANQSTTYTKTEVDTALNAKADQSTTYTKTEVDTALSSKANSSDVTAALALKADQATTYTKTEVDTALGNKSEIIDLHIYNNAIDSYYDVSGTENHSPILKNSTGVTIASYLDDIATILSGRTPS